MWIVGGICSAVVADGEALAAVEALADLVLVQSDGELRVDDHVGLSLNL